MTHTNPWASDFANDLKLLEQVGDHSDFAREVENKIFELIKPGELRDYFCNIDLSIIRHSRFRSCVPPLPSLPNPNDHPQTIPPTLDGTYDGNESDDGDAQRPFICNELLADGSICGARFFTEQRLAAHMAASRGGTHLCIQSVTALCMTNECIACGKVYSTRKNAQQHLSRSLRNGKCRGPGCSFKTQPKPYPAKPCPYCNAPPQQFSNPRLHLALHLPRFLVAQVEGTIDLD